MSCIIIILQELYMQLRIKFTFVIVHQHCAFKQCLQFCSIGLHLGAKYFRILSVYPTVI